MPRTLILLLIVALMLPACAAPAATVTPTSTKTVTPVAQATEPPAAAQATDTPLPPTAAPEPATDTPPADTPAAPTDTPAAPTDTPPPPTNTPAAAPPPSGAANMRSPDYGAQAFLWWREEIADRDLTLMADAGFRWVKQWFAWEDIEGAGKGQYDWSIADRVVRQVEEHGLKLLVRVSTDPDTGMGARWAGPPPGNTQHLADFLAALATRYRGRIHAYQVWNEPNLAREWGDRPPNPVEYVRMLGAAYAAIKNADPSAIVVTAGMAPTSELSARAVPDTDFYSQMYQAMRGASAGYFDMLGVHGAGFKAPPEADPGDVAVNAEFYNVGDPNCPGPRCRVYSFRHIEDIRQLMVQNGDANKRMVVLEFGWTTDDRPGSPYYWHGRGGGIGESRRANYLRRAYEYAQANWQPWIGLMSLVYMPDLNWTPDDEQYWWAIMDPSPIDQTYWRNAFIELCIYFNEQSGRPRCPFAP